MTPRRRNRTVAVMTTSLADPVDQAAIGEFAGRFMGMLNDSMLISMLDLGRRTGLIDALAEGPGTSDDIADRAGLNERYVREWLGALVTGGIAAYDPAAATYNLPSAAAAEPRRQLSSNLEDNVGNPFAPMTYAVSTLHCMTISLAEGGAGLGTAFGEQLARRMLYDAGVTDITVHEAPGDPL